MVDSVLITGAAGRLGTALRRGLRGRVRRLHLTDLKPLTAETADEVVSQGDIGDWDTAMSIVRDVDAVVHAAGIPDEAPFDDLVQANIRATYHVFEAARRHGAGRVVLASSSHVTGFYPQSQVIDELAPVRPDTLYGATKVFTEALARMYYDKHGIEVACLRIGSFRPQPETRRQLSTWLSPRDAVELVARCLDAQPLGFRILYGVSANQTRFWSTAAYDSIAFKPADDAAEYADSVADDYGPDGVDQAARTLQGGVFTTTDYQGGHG